MKDKALYYYRQGYNCSQCVLKAAEVFYRRPLPKGALDMCAGVTGGFGTGSFCSVLVAAIMIFGWFFDEDEVKSMRIRLLSEFGRLHGSTECARLRKGRAACEQFIADTAELVEIIVADARG